MKHKWPNESRVDRGQVGVLLDEDDTVTGNPVVDRRLASRGDVRVVSRRRDVRLSVVSDCDDAITLPTKSLPCFHDGTIARADPEIDLGPTSISPSSVQGWDYARAVIVHPGQGHVDQAVRRSFSRHLAKLFV